MAGGVCIETDDQRFRVLTKLVRKSCDLMVLNGPAAMDALDNSVQIFDRTGEVIANCAGTKQRVASGILQVIQDRLVGRAAS